jgi:SAM-dependent methyltransferase
VEKWYYQIELPDGSFTNGRPQQSLAMCRKFFPRIEKAGCRVLDIGSQDFVAPILFQRQGAREVVAYDRLKLDTQRNIVEKAYRARFHYASGMPLLKLKESLREQGIDAAFDYVNFCGVLYHMVDPLAGLAIARSFVRTGGILLLETSFSVDPGYVARINHAAQLYPGSNYFQVSLEALDYWLRMLRMQILDAAFTDAWRNIIGRVVAVCRAVESPVADPDDAWMAKPWIETDFAPYGLDYSALASTAPPVTYRPEGKPLVMRPGLKSVDLYATYKQFGSTHIDESLGVLRLKDVA